ncbi:MAG: M36 family metallopeptidase [Candidatus Saccharibacteria bacterium]
MIDLKKAQVRYDRRSKKIKKVYGSLSEPLAYPLEKSVVGFLRENAQVLQMEDVVKHLRFERIVPSLGGSTVLFQQHHDGIPAHSAWVAVHLNKERKVFMVKNDTVPVPDKLDHMGLDRYQHIINEKIKSYGTLSTPVIKEYVLLHRNGGHIHALKVRFGTRKPAASWVLFFDRSNGKLIEERDLLWKAAAQGRVFMPNPVVTLNNDYLRDQNDSAVAVPESAYYTVELKGLNGSGYLKGAYVDTSATKQAVYSKTQQFMFDRHDPGFEETMAYFHIDTYQRYLQSLGFKDNLRVGPRPINVNAHGTEEDNSWYDPSPGANLLVLGNGGVDDGEDAEVIIHEYGHAIQDSIVPDFGQGDEARAMGEGFSDYLAGSYYGKYKGAARKPKLMQWDAKGIEDGPQDYLRRLDSSKRYPRDMKGEEHADGEIWSACLWQARAVMGQARADTAVIESIHYLNQYSDFRDGADALILASNNLYGSKYDAALYTIFRRRGIYGGGK